jgi:hypothetical protein
LRKRFPSVLAALIACAAACHTQPASPRYLYVVTCDARVDKLDIVAGRKVASVDLTQVPGAKQLIPDAGDALDGCLAYSPNYDVKSSTLYVAAPVQPTNKPDGTRDYRGLGFSIPDLKLVKNLSALTGLSKPPRIEILSSPVLSDEPAFTPPPSLDLSGYAPANDAGRNQRIDRSGDRVLLRIFAADPATLQLAVADTAQKRLTLLKDAPPTTAPLAHLAPGGDFVLIEATTGAGQATKTGRLVLFDSASGKELKEVQAPQSKDQYFLAMAPSGYAVFHSGEQYAFVDLGLKAKPEFVFHLLDANYPALFYASK